MLLHENLVDIYATPVFPTMADTGKLSQCRLGSILFLALQILFHAVSSFGTFTTRDT